MMTIEEKYDALKAIVRGLQRVVVAFSGGVDSTFLLKTCLDVLGKENVLAFIGRSPTCPGREVKEATMLAGLMSAQYVIVETDEMDDPLFIENSRSRCYFCKGHLFVKAKEMAAHRGFSQVVEGSNLDDTHDFRPGRKACEEQKIRSPLLEAGLGKEEIRELSKRLSLPTHDKPAFACLSSRVPYGTAIDEKILKQIENAEDFILGLGIRQVRVRYHGDVARIEVSGEDMDLIMAQRESIAEALIGYGFSYVALDLRGYRMGSMNIRQAPF